MSQSHTLENAIAQIAGLPLPPASQAVSLETDEQLRQWLCSEANEKGLIYLLAHADDGIIWGRFDGQGGLTTANEAGFSESQKVNLPALRLLTLQQCRMFGPAGETLLWRGNGGWRSRHLSAEWAQPYIDSKNCQIERQLLWGTNCEQVDRFTLLQDGSQGLKHAIPITQGIAFDAAKPSKLTHPIRLVVHHYIHYEDDGVARIFLSRLVDFDSQK